MKALVVIAIVLAAIVSGTSAEGGGPAKYELEFVSSASGTAHFLVAWPGRRSNFVNAVGIRVVCRDRSYLGGGAWVPNDGTYVAVSAPSSPGEPCSAWAYRSAAKHSDPDQPDSNVVSFVG